MSSANATSSTESGDGDRVQQRQRQQLSAGAGQSPHITKENIDSFNYFQLFGLATPTATSAAASTGGSGGGSDAAIPDIDVAAVRRVYRRLSLRFHPDKDDSEEARHAFEVVHTALETIIDPTKLAAYLKTLVEGSGAGGSRVPGEEARQRQRAHQAHVEAQWAATMLVQRAQERLAKEAAARQAAQEREEATQRLLSELTSSLNTPFQLMEAELVRDWDVDEEMVAIKTKEVTKVLRQLESADGAWASYLMHEGASRKRNREDTAR
ncbi:DNAJ family-like protein [Leishmania infantum JPCM5]|uniref:DNAJ_family-like_protein n=3 Tax=Leishmania donovani species complex TaxID=38574 RepID=A0A6L0XZG2_LEIIN|nr:DNAJ family-like protein [Leishmania infantum JPCM5]XP_003864107.1 DNAJ family-like protein [Leishmania donovani]CAC9534123.1 DNAJ_family-like_protein [Leishmania infantum]AYU82265.1 DNAJ family-like protein [Leishmania donovani]TPP53598.1 DnaJ domain family protein [Leishmania donovani]CAM71412.1 DNAJ family-like protein [Leishmania infantum JPCM5]CBZ37425.1 DNAJ family-like protein [Leishmania donovani]|eukprot:XP_001468328.1 DNAJ family-like protein [Leishmania infantum JPCM5]